MWTHILWAGVVLMVVVIVCQTAKYIIDLWTTRRR